MTDRRSTRRRTRLSAMLAVAAMMAAPGAIPTSASADTTADPAIPTLQLNVLDRNGAILQADPCCTTINTGLEATVLNGETAMQPLLDGTERGYADPGELVWLYNLERGARYDISVRYTDAKTGEVFGTTNTVSFTTEPSTDVEPPTPPTNLRFVEGPPPQLPGHVNIVWDDATDNVDSGRDIQYVVRRNGNLTNGTTEAAPGDVFTVTAIDRSNNAAQPARTVFTGDVDE
ncbi:hypothetical protein [Jiangella asiatica]|uniref:Fibronectin type III domain-containing protein n=1 Tax=Jiangella asiatica TaxID=2530372 RepID=A0A4R5DBS8_9ACTN|nr:hypothetical protein [Jiangella asiatica]TDE09261.1 hypothetical protein E1269_14645 [Jiangella asiatica]